MNSPEQLWGEYNQFVSSTFDPQSARFVDFANANRTLLRQYQSADAKVAIVIPAYNEEKLIARSLAGINMVLNHDPRMVDVVVVNNASTDCTSEIAQFFGARVVAESTKGIAKARQAGLEAVNRSEITLTTDADSMVSATWLLAHIQTLQSPDIVFSGGGIKFVLDGTLRGFDQLGYTTYNWLRYIYQKLLKPRFSQLNPTYCGANSAFRTAQGLEVGYRTDVNVGEDTFIMHDLVDRFGGSAAITNTLVLSSNRRSRGGGLWRQTTKTAKIFVKLCLGVIDEVNPHQDYPDYR